MDTTNNRLVINDGSTPGGAPAAKLSRGPVPTRGRPSATPPIRVLTSDRMVAYTALTAARVVSLPASSAYPTGTRLLVIDESGNCSVTKTLTLTAAGRTRSMAPLRRSSIKPTASSASRATAPGIGRSSTKASCQRSRISLRPLTARTIQAQVLETARHPVRRIDQRLAPDPGELHRPGGRRPRGHGDHGRDFLRGRRRRQPVAVRVSALALAAGSSEFRAHRSDRLLHEHHASRSLRQAARSRAARSGCRSPYFSRIRPPRSGFLFPIGSDMKRILLGAAGAACLLFGVPACAQTYQDSGGTIVRGMVPIQPGVGPLFTRVESGKDFRLVLSVAERLSADAGLCAALRWGDVGASRASERIGRHRLQYGLQLSVCDAWDFDRHRDGGQRRHPGRRLDGVHRWPEHISCRD